MRTKIPNYSEGHAVEEMAAAWLRNFQGFFVSNRIHSGVGAPALRRGESEFLILPDLVGAKNGSANWIEVKYCENVGFNKRQNSSVLGLKTQHFDHYQKVQVETGIPVLVLFFVENEKAVFWQSLSKLKKFFPCMCSACRNEEFEFCSNPVGPTNYFPVSEFERIRIEDDIWAWLLEIKSFYEANAN